MAGRAPPSPATPILSPCRAAVRPTVRVRRAARTSQNRSLGSQNAPPDVVPSPVLTRVAGVSVPAEREGGMCPEKPAVVWG